MNTYNKEGCTCDGWKNSWDQVEGAQLFYFNHGGEYTGEIFKFCPWCGTKKLCNVNDICEK